MDCHVATLLAMTGEWSCATHNVVARSHFSGTFFNLPRVTKKHTRQATPKHKKELKKQRVTFKICIYQRRYRTLFCPICYSKISYIFLSALFQSQASSDKFALTRLKFA
jgi:hypothetical protein